ncbi:MAG: hypothetical protein ACE5HT_14230 [Gemmatimonadales bacterium]
MGIVLLAAAIAVSPTQADTTYLYRTLLVQAAPGQLLDVIEMYRNRVPVYKASSDHPPFMLRHSQGDHWDLMLIFPIGSMSEFYSSKKVLQRRRAAREAGKSEAEFQHELGQRVLWREELFAKGPPLDKMEATMTRGAFYHVEMFVALAGKRDALFREREMENQYLAQLGRNENLLFTRAGGAAWDCFTIGVYENLRDFAASGDNPPDLQQAAALAAGFEGRDRIGTYLRTLILRHHDTLAGAVTLER